MSDVSRLTPMAVMVLALLDEGDMHPYEMGRLLRLRRDERLVTVTNGTLYHTVGRLLSNGLIAELGVDRDGNRPERTTYRLLPAGAETMREWIRRELPRIDRPVQFRIALAEAHNLDADEVRTLLGIRLEALDEEQAQYRLGIDGARGKGVPDQFLLEIDRQTALVAADRQWMRTLLARFDADDVPWGHASRDEARYLAQRKAAQQ